MKKRSKTRGKKRESKTELLLTPHDYFRIAIDKGFKNISAFHMQHADDDDVCMYYACAWSNKVHIELVYFYNNGTTLS